MNNWKFKSKTTQIRAFVYLLEPLVETPLRMSGNISPARQSQRERLWSVGVTTPPKSLWVFRLLIFHGIFTEFTCPGRAQLQSWVLFLFFFLFALAVLGLRCCSQAFSACGDGDSSSWWCTSFSSRWLLLAWSAGSVVGTHELSCPTARGVFSE